MTAEPGVVPHSFGFLHFTCTVVLKMKLVSHFEALRDSWKWNLSSVLCSAQWNQTKISTMMTWAPVFGITGQSWATSFITHRISCWMRDLKMEVIKELHCDCLVGWGGCWPEASLLIPKQGCSVQVSMQTGAIHQSLGISQRPTLHLYPTWLLSVHFQCGYLGFRTWLTTQTNSESYD